MKTHLLLAIALMSLILKGYSQDTSKVQITFQTKPNQQIPLFKHIILGDIDLEGYVESESGSQLVRQTGTLSKDEFLFNAPNIGYFEKNKPVVLVMTDDYSNRIKFTIHPGVENQKWMLTPPGIDYQKSLTMKRSSIGGVVLSTLLLSVIMLNNNYKIQSYHMKLDYYNATKNGFFDPGTPPQAPKYLGFKYLLPAFTYGLSIHAIIKGRKLYNKNKPYIERIE